MTSGKENHENIIHRITRFQHDALLLLVQNWKKVGEDAAFSPVVTLIGPGAQMADVSKQMAWGDEHEKLLKMHALTAVCRTVGALGVVLSSDVRLVEMETFARYFQIDVPIPFATEENWNLVRQRYLRILNDDYGGEVENLPHSLWRDSIMTVCKGPGVGHLQFQTEYNATVDGIVKLGETSISDGGDIEMLHPWWEDPDDDGQTTQ
jgi:hypothetical protein